MVNCQEKKKDNGPKLELWGTPDIKKLFTIVDERFEGKDVKKKDVYLKLHHLY